MNSAMRRGRLQTALADAVTWLSTGGAGAVAGKRQTCRLDFADALVEVVHPEAVAEQFAASAQRAESLRRHRAPGVGTARQLHRPLPQASDHADRGSLRRRGAARWRPGPGRARCAGSHTTRTAANGKPCRAANAAATWDSMSTASAPVALRNARFSPGDSTALSTPARSAMITRFGWIGEACRDATAQRSATPHGGGPARRRRSPRSRRRARARVKAAGDADADDGAAIRLHPGAQQRPQSRRIAARHDGGDAGAGREPGLGRHSGHRQDRLAMLRRPRQSAGG